MTEIHLTLKDIHLRDPFVLREQDQYFLYGTRGATVWTEAEGFDCYTSSDLVAWEGPYEIFHRPQDFWADRSFWAPECCRYGDAYYLVTTFGSGEGRLGVELLRAESPLGPFSSWSGGPVTPPGWECLDGTLWFDDASTPDGALAGRGTPFLVFSRSFRQAGEGQMLVLEMTSDLRAAEGEPRMLFNAAGAPWSKPFPFAKDFGIDGEAYLSDGPFPYRTKSGKLLLLWSSFGVAGYTVGVARSRDGGIAGPWVHDPEPLFAGDGGHCMVFRSKEGKCMMALHSPNTKGAERPRFVELMESGDDLSLIVKAEGRSGE